MEGGHGAGCCEGKGGEQGRLYRKGSKLLERGAAGGGARGRRGWASSELMIAVPGPRRKKVHNAHGSLEGGGRTKDLGSGDCCPNGRE